MPRGSSGRDLRVKAGLRAGGGAPDKANRKLDRSLAQAQCLLEQALCQIDPNAIVVGSPNDLYKLTVASAALTRSRIELERWQAEKMGFLSEATDMLIAAVRAELASRPELVEEVQNVIDAAARATAENLLPEA